VKTQNNGLHSREKAYIKLAVVRGYRILEKVCGRVTHFSGNLLDGGCGGDGDISLCLI
jgi:hypothetical protein